MSDRKRLMAVLEEAVDAVVTDQCCSSCSVAALPLISPTFAYFHEQDAETAFDKDGKGDRLIGKLYIGFGADEETPLDEARSLTVGQRLVNELNAAGFITDWDHTVGRRIAITGITETRTFE